MGGLKDLISAGKVNYIGISNTPAWIIAQFRDWGQFIGLQVEYSLLQRTSQRDLIPMAKIYLGLALTPWAPLAVGALTGKYLKGEDGRVAEGSARRSDWSVVITKKVVELADQLGVSPAQVAVKWAIQKGFTSIPIVGGCKLHQIEDSLKSTSIHLPEKSVAELDEVSAIEFGFPHDFLQGDNVKQLLFDRTFNNIDM